MNTRIMKTITAAVLGLCVSILIAPSDYSLIKNAEAAMTMEEEGGLAVIRGRFYTLKKLLNEGLNPNAAIGQTTLLMAATSRNWPSRRTEKIMRLLIEHGADVNAISAHDESAMTIAISFKDRESIKLLKENGANEGSYYAMCIVMPLRDGEYIKVGGEYPIIVSNIIKGNKERIWRCHNDLNEAIKTKKLIEGDSQNDDLFVSNSEDGIISQISLREEIDHIVDVIDIE